MNVVDRPLPATAPAARPARVGLDGALWLAALVSFPFYLGPSGSVQVSSVILMLSFLATAIQTTRHQFSIPRLCVAPVWILGAFVLWSVVVNFTWAAVLGDSQPLLVPLFYAFNFLVFATAVAMYAMRGAAFIELTRWGLLVSVALQFLLSILLPSGGYREDLFFNNPNQLGYFALICASIFALPRKEKLSLSGQLPWILGLLMSLWLATLSLSKSATLACILLLLLSSARHLKQFAVGAVIALLAAILLWEAVENRVLNLGSRYQTIGAEGSDDDLEGRGYDRMWLYPEMLILGAGEGVNERWSETMAAQLVDKDLTLEMHSTIGTIAFSYGVPGICLAVAFFSALLRPAFLALLPFTIPELFYSLTHMSLRFVLTWVYFAMLLCCGVEIFKSRQERQYRRALPQNRIAPHEA